jgi:REP element-mobilizing transposase RayT
VPHSYSSSLFHIVFSTHARRNTIHDEFREKLWAYVGGIARKNGMKAIAVGGTGDHLHVLLSIPASMALAKAVQLIKGGSSKWVHDTYPQARGFAWQEGYGAFSVGISQADETAAYILNQEKHHKRRTFQEEFLAFLKKHKMEYDPRYVWG